MDKVKRWFNKPKRREQMKLHLSSTPSLSARVLGLFSTQKSPSEDRNPTRGHIFTVAHQAVEIQQMIRPLTSDTKHHAGSDPAETLSPANQLLESLLLDIRDLDRDLISHFIMQDSDPDLLVTTRLSMLRDLLQGPQSGTPPSAQVKRVTGEKLLLGRRSPGTGDAIGPAGCRDVLDLRVSRDTASLPSSPHPGWRRGRRGRRMSGSLPCSPLLGERRSFPTPPSASSRLWVEAALQRSKNPTRGPTPPQGLVEVELSDLEGEDEEDHGQWTSESFRYCLQTPCTCCRCPSAPPFEDAHTSSPDHHWTVTRLGVDGGSAQLGQRSKLYPSLSLWRLAGDRQNEVSGENVDGLLQLQMTSDGPGEEQTWNSADIHDFMNTFFDFQTAQPEKPCSFCSFKPSEED